MKTSGSNQKLKLFHQQERPSRSLHNRFIKHEQINFKPHRIQKQSNSLIVCILFKKHKIKVPVPINTSLEELSKRLYEEMVYHLLKVCLYQEKKVEKIMNSVRGFESTDGNYNFDYQFSLKRGSIKNTKFFYPFFKKEGNCKYKIYKCLAIGGFSKVYLARSYEDGQFYVIKIILKDPHESIQLQKQQSLKNEIQVSSQLDHPFLAKLHHAFKTKKFHCMVFQYCPGGELFFLLKRLKIMSQEMAKFYFLQILHGIQHLHSKNILYRDLKPENILLDKNGNAKVVDFGLSKHVSSKSKTFSYCGSAQYMAPEMIMRKGHSFGIDYYALGALLYELVTGLPPFYTRDQVQLHQNIVCQDLSFPGHVQLSSQIKDLLEKLLRKDEKQRLGSIAGVKEIIFHPWVGKVKSEDVLKCSKDAPYSPDLTQLNFDPNQLGDDEPQFTQIVQNTFSSKNERNFEDIYKSKVKQIIFDTKGCISSLMKKFQCQKQNSITVSETKRPFILNSCNNLNRMKQKSPRKVNGSFNVHQDHRKILEICKLSPYLNCLGKSPKNQKDLKNIIDTRILRNVSPKKLRKIKVKLNALQQE